MERKYQRRNITGSGKMKQRASTEKYRQFITVKFAASRPKGGGEGRLVTAVKTTSNRDSSSMIYHG